MQKEGAGTSQLHKLFVCLRPAITEELPCIPNFANLVKIQLGSDQLSLVSRRVGEKLSTRIAEVALSVKLADIPGLLVSNPIDCADEISVGHSVRRLLELP